MRKKAFTLLLSCLGLLTGMSQSVAITNPATKEIYWGAAGGTVNHNITFSAINLNNPASRLIRIDCIPDYTASTAKVPVFSGFTSPGAPPVPPVPLSESATISLFTPAPVPTKNRTIVLRFQLILTDTVIFNYDTLTITQTPPPPPVPPLTWRSPKNKSNRWVKDEKNIFRSEVSQFTDFNGFDNQKPNGLLQEELILKFPIVQKKRQWNKKTSSTFYQYFRSVVFTALFNRIDKTKNSQDYPVGATLPYNSNKKDSIQAFLTTMDIYKYSNLQLGLNFNLFTLHVGNLRINLDYEFSVLRNKPYFGDTIRVLDTQFVKSDVRHIYSFVHRFEFFANTNNLIKDDVGLSINGGIMLIRLKDSYFKQFDAAVVDPFDRATTLLPAGDLLLKRTARPIWFFSGTLKKLWGEDKKNTTFFRVSYSYQTGKYKRYVGEPDVTPGNFDPRNFRSTKFHNHFLQLQLGIALDFSKFLGAEKK